MLAFKCIYNLIVNTIMVILVLNYNIDELVIKPPTTFIFDNNSFNKNEKSLKIIDKNDANRMFRFIKWKENVNLYTSTYGYTKRYKSLFASYNDVKTEVSPNNIGYFIENIETEIEAKELAMFFNYGILILNKTNYNEFIKAYKEAEINKLATINKYDIKDVEVICESDNKNEHYIISYVYFEDNDLNRATFYILKNGMISFKYDKIAKGFELISLKNLKESNLGFVIPV